MSRESLEARMDRLERRVDLLEQLPRRMDALEAQIVQLREEMRSEFSAIRVDMRAGDEETRRVLSKEMRELFEANETHMRVLHEDLVQRIATLRDH
jgi:predicted  nucleic acid-binding Zn-ribbon protein